MSYLWHDLFEFANHKLKLHIDQYTVNEYNISCFQYTYTGDFLIF